MQRHRRFMTALVNNPDNSQSREWCRSLRLLADSMNCAQCNESMTEISVNDPDRKKWRCRICGKKTSIRHGSIFGMTALRKSSLQNIIRFLWQWSLAVDHRAIYQLAYLNIKAARALRTEIHRICIKTVIDENPTLPNVTIAVDESVFIKRKNHVGRLPANQAWVLGLVSLDDPTKVLFFYVADRSGDTLLSVIQQHVAAGSTVVTDCWAGYRGLAGLGFNHLTVNHTQNFVDPRTGAHTQHIENAWRLVKRFIRETRSQCNTPLELQQLLHVYMWRQWYGRSSPSGMFARLLTDITRKYPV